MKALMKKYIAAVDLLFHWKGGQKSLMWPQTGSGPTYLVDVSLWEWPAQFHPPRTCSMVSQGSILGAILSSIYMLFLGDIHKYVQFHCYSVGTLLRIPVRPGDQSNIATLHNIVLDTPTNRIEIMSSLGELATYCLYCQLICI